MSCALSIRNLTCQYDQQTILESLSLHVEPGQIVCLLGASGCGKTTLLKAIAGLLPLSAGEMCLNGVTIDNGQHWLPPEQRNIGMIFQDYALFPHLTVADNVGFGLKGFSQQEKQHRVAEMLDLVHLSAFAQRYPHQLSGGQQQRVAIARSLAYKPDLLLLDEPFSNIDTQVRHELIGEIRKLFKAQGHFDLMSRQQVSDESIKSLTGNQTSIVTTFLMCFGVLAMFVAALVIANTFQVLVAQRRRTLALLRTIGAKKGQLYGSVLFEAAVLGFVASVLGVMLGSLLMWGMCVSDIMQEGMRFNFSWQAAVIPILFGIVVTVLASLGSARSATAVTPLEALRPIELTDNRRSSLTRAIIGILMVVVGIAMVVFSIWQVQATNGGENASSDQFTMILLVAIAGAALVFLGMVVTAVFWMPALMKGVGALASLTGPSATVAHANIQKNPRRIAATGAALLIGVTLVSTIATGAASAKETMNGTLATRYSVDIVAMGDDISQQMVKDVADINGVSDTLYAPAVSVTLEKADGTQPTSALLVGVKNIDQVKQVMRANLGNASIDSDGVLMPTYNAQTGKKLQFANGTADFSTEWNQDGDATRSLTLQANQADYRRVSAQYGAVGFVDESHFTNGDLDAATHVLLVKADTDKSGVSVDGIYNDMQAALEKSTDATVTGPIAERIVWAKMIDSMMMLLVGLIAVAVLIALVGVANTLSLSVIERTRESATLRAIGMTRGQLRRSLAVEALLISLVSGIAGVLLGTLFGWLGAYVVFSLYGTVAFPFEWGINGIVLAVAAVAALLASIAPARRAVRVPPVEALAEA